MEALSVGEELLEERCQGGQAGDPRLPNSDREILRRVATGERGAEFHAALDADVFLGGHENNNDD